MIRTAAVTLLAFIAAGLCLAAGWGARVAVIHLVFAVGIAPLIFAAISHFVPVLTRTGEPTRAVRHLPAAAQAAGLLAVIGMQGWLPWHAVYAAAGFDALFATGLLVWIFGRARRCLGTPHPGWRWYAAALVCLLAALGAVLAMALWPSAWRAFKLFHLHVNTLGLVGLAALGTLPVLLPTALAQPDPQAAPWLRRWLWPTLAAVLAIGLGGAAFWPVSTSGALVLLAVLVGVLRHWRDRFGSTTLTADGVSASLAGASCGLVVLLLAGILHGAGFIEARPSLGAWALGFLLPLVTGALSQLLPVWRWPGPVLPCRKAMRERLAAGGQGRAGAFLLAALAWLAGWEHVAVPFAAAGMLAFIVALLQAMRIRRPTR